VDNEKEPDLSAPGRMLFVDSREFKRPKKLEYFNTIGYINKSFYDEVVEQKNFLRKELKLQKEQSAVQIKRLREKIIDLKSLLAGRDLSRQQLVEEALIHFRKMLPEPDIAEVDCE
jgi:hypothetical protein